MRIILKLLIILTYTSLLTFLYLTSPYLAFAALTYLVLNILTTIDNKKDLEALRKLEQKDKELTIVNNKLMEALVKNMDEFLVCEPDNKNNVQ